MSVFLVKGQQQPCLKYEPLLRAVITDSGAEIAPESLSWSSVDSPDSTVGSASLSISMLSSGCRKSASLWNVRGRELDLDVMGTPRPLVRDIRKEEDEVTGECKASVSEAYSRPEWCLDRWWW